MELFNAGEYFEAHEALEIAWRAEKGPVRELYRGILQVSVAYYHLVRGNYVGALKMFSRSKPWLEPFAGTCRGIQLGQFKIDALAAEAELRRLGPQGIQSFNHGLLKPIQYTRQVSPDNHSR